MIGPITLVILFYEKSYHKRERQGDIMAAINPSLGGRGSDGDNTLEPPTALCPDPARTLVWMCLLRPSISPSPTFYE